MNYRSHIILRTKTTTDGSYGDCRVGDFIPSTSCSTHFLCEPISVCVGTMRSPLIVNEYFPGCATTLSLDDIDIGVTILG